MDVAHPTHEVLVTNQRVSTTEIEMNRHKPLFALASVLVLSSALPGCATFEKCGVSGCPGDTKITAEVQTRLQQDSATAAPNVIYVQTASHVVYLSGETDTRGEKEQAEAEARKVAGVTDVVNTIVGHFP
jgi:osmotically-inducible protein OsmY